MKARTIFITDPKLPLKISTVALELNEILRGSTFHDALEQYGRFDQSNITGVELSAEFRRILSTKQIILRPYTFPWYQGWRNKKVVAHVKNDSRYINLTNYFLGVNDDLQWARTIGHETTHIVDLLSPYHFGHGDNDPSGDDATASHIVGDLCAKIYRERRANRLALSAKLGEKFFNECLESLGATDKASLLRLTVGGFYGSSSKDSLHTID